MLHAKFLAATLLAGVALTSGLNACGDDDDDGAATAAGGAGSVTVEGAWARTSPANAEAGAVYMTLTAAADDALVRVAVDSTVAGTVEIHETMMADGGEDDGMGEMQMAPVASLPLPAGEAVSLEPGGYHVMLLDLAAPLESGSTIEVDLTFESGATQTVAVPVQDEAP